MFDNWGNKRYRNKLTGQVVIKYSTSHGTDGAFCQVVDCNTQIHSRIPEKRFIDEFEVIEIPNDPVNDSQLLYHIKEYYSNICMSAMRFLTPGYFEEGAIVYLTRPFLDRNYGYGIYGPEHPFVISRIRTLNNTEDLNVVFEVSISHYSIENKDVNVYARFQYSRIDRHSADAFEMLRRYDKDY